MGSVGVLKLYLDLDRTLFRTTQFCREYWYTLAELFPTIKPEYELTSARQTEFYRYNQGLYTYDLMAHLENIGVDAKEAQRYITRSSLADGRFEYPGVAALIQWARSKGEVAVLTYGMEATQRFKVGLCPSLAGVPIITILHPKTQFFQTLLQDDAETRAVIWMVDDKPIGGELPLKVKFIQALIEEQPIPDAVPWPVATTLDQVPRIIAQDPAELPD